MMPFGLRLRRLLWLVPLSLVLAGLAGYVGAIVLPQAIAVWVSLLFLYGLTLQGSAFLLVLAGPALYGLRWTWPAICVALPLASLVVPRAGNAIPLVYMALGATATAATGFIGARLGVDGINPDDTLWFVLAGVVAGAAAGILFGLAVRVSDPHSQ